MPINKFKLEDTAYQLMLQHLDNLLSAEKSGNQEDTFFIQQEFWLQNTAVIENIEPQNGEWNIFLVFADYLQPLKLIKRKIVQYSCIKKAKFNAHYMRRQAAKDQRGTLTLSIKMFNANFN